MDLTNFLTIIGLLAVPGLGAAYGYLISRLGRQRQWRVHKVRRTAIIPLACLGLVFLITGFYIELTRSGHHIALMALGSVCTFAALLSARIAVKRVRPGVPVDVPDAGDISIR